MERKLNRKPLSDQIATILRREIRKKYSPGQPFATDQELVDRFKTSRVTIRQATLILAKEGLLERSQGKRTVVTVPESSRQWVAVLCNRDLSLQGASPFALRVVQRARNYLEENDVPVRLYIGNVDPVEVNELGLGTREQFPAEFLEDVRHDRIQGLILVQTPVSAKWYEPLRKRGVPVVGQCPMLSARIIEPNYADTEKALRYLLDQGCRRIAVMTWFSICVSIPENPSPVSLRQKIKDLMDEYGASFRDQWVGSEIYPAKSEAGWVEFRRMWNAYPEKPDGLVIAEDMYVSSAVKAMLELQIRVPAQMKLVYKTVKGYDLFVPYPATRLEVDPDARAEAQCRMLLDVMKKGESSASTLSFSARLIDEGGHRLDPV